jgi:regulator of nucleoside diphosphate kinase
MHRNGILVTESDLRRLQHCTRGRRTHDDEAVDALRDDLARAHPVSRDEVPPDLVTLDTTFVIRDLATDALATYTLVVPGEANPARLRISALAPLGLATLGRRVGDVAEWQAPGGLRRARIERILFQPEAARGTDVVAATEASPPLASVLPR